MGEAERGYWNEDHPILKEVYGINLVMLINA